MSYHIINIDTPEAYLTCKKNQLICKDGKGAVRQLPLEDVAAIVITSFSATVHSQLINEAARLGTALIFCRNFKPQSLLLPADRASDTLLTKTFTVLDARSRVRFWDRTIAAKCLNQLAVAKIISPQNVVLPVLCNRTQVPRSAMESVCARYYWQIWAGVLQEPLFKRGDESFAQNKWFDFSYAVLASLVAQKAFAVGLDVTYGIGHAEREHAWPLVYDLMEPFRPFLDLGIYAWKELQPMEEKCEVNGAFKRHILNFLRRRILYENKEMQFLLVVEKSLGSFRNALLQKDIELYKPWIGTNLKWDGCL